LDEKYIIDQLKKQDKIVFDFVFTYYYSGLCIYAKQFVGSIEAAEDIVQDFFVHLWIKASTIQIDHSLKAYLFVSVKNSCLDSNKHQLIREKFKQSILRDSQEGDSNLFDKYVEAELREAINKSLEKLSPKCREIFVLSRFNGKTNQEIAESLGISKRTVELQVTNALKILRAELKNYLPICLIYWILK
jgi:RNA polymerase sigma-70 factor, ECF subfamily